MSIMQTLFGSKPAAAPVAVALPVQQQPQTQIPAADGAPALTNNPTVPAASMEKPVGLDEFNKIWEPGEPAKPDAPMFNVDPAQLAASAKRNDFSKVVTPEMMTAIAGGGEAAVAATLSAMNSMAQKVFADSALTTTKIVESALGKQQAKFEASLPGFIKSQNLSDNLRNSNPLFNHPAAAPILKMFETQVAQKFPNATVAEQQEMAMRYVTSFAEAANPPKQTAAQKANANTTDWSEFF